MLAAYPFGGQMNLDDPSLVLPQGQHIMARNGIFRGNKGRMRFESCLGTNVQNNSFLPGTGINLTIGVRYDAVNQRVFFFVYNSAGNHGIYIYYTLTKTFQRLIQNSINTSGDVLGFTASGRITSIDILYGDGNSGDLLFFVDSLGRCRKLNINRLLAGTYTNIQSSYLDVIKAPPIPPPQCTYENDQNVTNNNLVNSLFNFSCTHIYDDFEQSVLGSGSKQPLPSDPFDPQNNTPATRNARIAIYLPTGDQNVTNIRIYGKQTSNGTTTDWFIIDTLNKAQLGIANNTVYKYLFYNNGNYIASDPTFTVLDYDVVPTQANAQALLDGDIISYGGITEGYNFFNPSFSIVTSNANTPVKTLNGTAFFAATNGLFSLTTQPQITVYLTGVGINDGFGNPTTLEKPPASMFVRVKSGITDVTFGYLNTTNSNSIPFLLNALKTVATSAGWISVSSTSNSFTVYYPTGNVVLQSSYINGVAGGSSPYQSPIGCFYPLSAYSFGVLYRDYAGRTNGVISNTTGNIKTQAPGTTGQIPEIAISLAGFIPPIWASYYEIVRTDTLTYQKYFYWISAGAYQGTANGTSTLYAYFDISNIQSYNTSISATQDVISYTFSQGDRIKILGRYDSSGNFTALNYDYAIIGSPTSIIANGVVKTGQFAQIYYPSVDVAANPDFQFPTTVNDTNFQNYEILIYSYRAFSTTNQNVYYQIGQQYGIGNPGTNSAYHMGNTADNMVQLSDGDIFYRQRTIPLVSTYSIPTGSYDQGSTYSTLWINPGGNNIPIVDNGIWSIVGDVHKVAGITNTSYPLSIDTGWTIRNETTTTTLSIRLSGTQPVVDKTDQNGQFAMYVKVVLPGNVVQLTQILPLQTGMQPGVSNSYTFDQTVSLPPQGKLWIINYAVNEMLIGGFTLNLQVIRNLTINVFDQSFSDIYELKSDVDNKPNVINTEALTTYYSTLFRYSQADQLGTDVNNSNRFYPDNFDEFDISYGDIIRLRVHQREMRAFQKRRCGRVGIYQKFVTNQAGSVSLIVSDTIITPNNIQYFEGEWGIGNQPDSLCSSGYADYFVDPVKAYFCRLSEDGIIPISELYKVQTYAGAKLPVYLSQQYTYAWGGNSVILGCYNFTPDRDSEALFCFQAGSNGVNSIPGEMLAFNERQNSFYGFQDWAPDAVVCAENLLISFFNGRLFSHDNSAQPAAFYGTQQIPSITTVFHEPTIEKKTFLSITEVANQAWVCPAISTNTASYGQILQQSNLVAEDFTLLGTDWNSSFWYDANSPGLLINGDPLQGNLIVIQFSTSDPTVFAYLSNVGIRYIDSPLTVK